MAQLENLISEHKDGFKILTNTAYGVVVDYIYAEITRKLNKNKEYIKNNILLETKNEIENIAKDICNKISINFLCKWYAKFYKWWTSGWEKDKKDNFVSYTDSYSNDLYYDACALLVSDDFKEEKLLEKMNDIDTLDFISKIADAKDVNWLIKHRSLVGCLFRFVIKQKIIENADKKYPDGKLLDGIFGEVTQEIKIDIQCGAIEDKLKEKK